MIQLENEIGMLEDARDYSKEANEQFNAPVPTALTDYLQKNKKTLHPQMLKKWESMGFKQKGTWQELFGADIYTDEIFMPLVPAIKKAIGKKQMFYVFLSVAILGMALLYIVSIVPGLRSQIWIIMIAQFIKSTGIIVATGYMESEANFRRNSRRVVKANLHTRYHFYSTCN